MSRLIVASTLLALLTTGARAQDPAAAPGMVLGIDAVALDRNGNVLTDLKRDQVEVWVEGHRIPIDTFIAVTPEDDGARRSVVLLLDDMTLSATGVARAKDVARRFVNRLAPGDQMTIIGLNGDATRSTDDRGALLRRIGAYNVRGAAMLRPGDLSAHVLTTLASISHQVAEAPARRRLIVAIGSGWVFDTPVPPASGGRDVRTEWTAAVRAMARANVTLYVIDPGGVGASRVGGGSSGFARETGGHAFTNTNDIDGAVARIMREAVSYYILRIAHPPMFRSAPLREVEVRLLRRGATIRARRYLAGPPG
ncbi:MAG: VWA domain-containing protein [Vicinamibacterales bacterium]